MKLVRTNINRDESKGPSIDDCLAHRCDEHKDIQPIDDSESSGAECGLCVGHKFVALYEEKVEEEILKTLFWPLIETARSRLNLLSFGSGERFVDEARQHVDEYRKPRNVVEGDAHAESRHTDH